MREGEFLKGTYPFDEIKSLLVSSKQNGVISDEKENA
jgi:hypothetical protein